MWRPAPDALRRLAAWTVEFDALPLPSLELAHRMGSPSSPLPEGDQRYLATVSAFVTFLYASGWMIPEFDWGAWQRTEEASRLRADDDGLETATAGQLAKVLTAIVRQDRFADGTIDAAIADRTVRRVLARAAELAREVP